MTESGTRRRLIVPTLAIATFFLALVVGVAWATRPLAEFDFPTLPGDEPVAAGTRIDTTFVIDRTGVARTSSITLTDRELLDAYMSGQITAERFLDRVGASWGFLTDQVDTCARFIQPVELAIEAAADGAVRVVVDEPSAPIIGQSRSLGICFPLGFPPADAAGTVALDVRDFAVSAITPAPATASVAADHIRYAWTSIAADGHIRVTLTQAPLAFLRELPKISPYQLVGGPVGNLVGLGLVLFAVALPAFLVLHALRVTMHERKDATIRRAHGLALMAGVLAVAPFVWQAANAVPSVIPVGDNELTAFVIDATGIARHEAVSLVVCIGVLVAAFGAAVLTNAASWKVARDFALVVAAASVVQIVMLLLAFAIAPASAGAPAIAGRGIAWIAGTLFGAAVLGWLILTLRSTGRPIERHTVAGLIGAATVALLLALPTGYYADRFLGSAAGLVSLTNDELIVMRRSLGDVVLLTALAAATFALWREEAWESAAGHVRKQVANGVILLPAAVAGTRDVSALSVSRAMFVALAVGNAGLIAGVPVSLALAWLAFPLLIWPPGKRGEIAALAARLRDYRPELTEIILNPRVLAAGVAANTADADGQGDGPDATAANEAKTGFPPIESKSGVPAYIGRLTKRLREVGKRREVVTSAWALASPPVVPQLTALAIGPNASPWRNALTATKWGAVMAAGLVIAYLITDIDRLTQAQSSPFLVGLFAPIAVATTGWLALAFFFGCSYEYIKGSTGLRKGLRVAALIIAITLPLNLYAGVASPLVVVLDALQVLVFLGVLGLLFDLAILGIDPLHVSAVRPALDALVSTSGLRPVAVFLGALATAAATAALAVVTGELTDLVNSALAPFLLSEQ